MGKAGRGHMHVHLNGEVTNEKAEWYQDPDTCTSSDFIDTISAYQRQSVSVASKKR